MIGKFIIRYEGLPINAPGVAKRELSKIMRGVWFQAGSLWHKKFRKKHFTAAGAREYGYKPRSERYIRRKLRVKGHKRPLEWSGRSRALTRIKDVRPTPKGVRVVLNAPGLNRRASANSPNMRDEMTRVSPRELTEIVKQMNVDLPRGINQNRTRSTVTV